MQPLTFNDIFSNSFIAIQNSMQKISSIDIIINLIVSYLVGMLIFFVYKRTFQGVLYQKSFNISLVAISMITSLVIMIISGNLILSLGMVGALSIVRFRTPIKDPVDLVFIFWAITVGIANGVGYFHISVIGSLVMSIVLFILTKKSSSLDSYLLIIQTDSDISAVLDYVSQNTLKSFLKSRSTTQNHTEAIIEVRLSKDSTVFLDTLQKRFKLQKSTLLAYSSDFAQI